MSAALQTTSLTPLPDVFLPYQQKLWQAIDRYPVVVAEKSRRTGFSWGLGAVAADYAGRARSAGGMDVLYMGYDHEMAREFIGYVADWAKVFSVAAEEVQEFLFTDPDHPEREIKAFRIHFASGFEVIALPSVARALRGKQGLVLIDEAAFIDDLDEVLKAAFALLMWGGKVVVVSTHNGETNAFNTLINDMRAAGRADRVLRVTLDDAMAQGLYKRICFVQGKEWTAEAEAAWHAELLRTYRDNADEELNVIPNPTSGVYFSGALLEARTVKDVPVLRWTSPPGFKLWPAETREREVRDWCRRELLPVLNKLSPDEAHALGEDFGRVKDLTVLWLLAITKSLMRQTRLVVELRDMPHEQQRQVLFFLLDGVPRFRKAIMDAGGNGSYLAEVAVQRYGETRVEGLQLSEPWYRDNMPPFKAAVEDAAMTLPADREVIDDLRMLKLVRGVARIPARRQTDEGATRHGDAAIAACLAYAASRADVEIYEYTAARRTDPDAPEKDWHDRAEDWDDDDRTPRSFLPGLRGGAMLGVGR